MNTGSLLRPATSAANATVKAIDCPPIHELVTPDRWHRWAVQYSEQKQFARAVQFFRHAIVLAPTDPLLRFDLGVACFKAALLNDAHASFSEALRLDPMCHEAQPIQRHLTDCLRHSDAAVATDAAMFSPPHHYFRRPQLGILYCPNSDLRNDVSACIELVAAIDRLYPLHLANENFITLARSHLSNTALLVAVARRLAGVLGRWPSKAAQWTTIEVGRAAKGLALRAVRQSPELECLLTAAAVLRLVGEHRHALVLLERAVGEYPDDLGAITAQAEVLLELGNAQAGERLLSSTIDSRSTQGQQRLARAKAAIGPPMAHP